jgi:hypothetical protein
MAMVCGSDCCGFAKELLETVQTTQYTVVCEIRVTNTLLEVHSESGFKTFQEDPKSV